MAKDITKLKKKLEKLVAESIKERDNYTCQRCGKRVEGSNCHASHVIPKSTGNILRFDELNLKVLCYHDHINWWHKNPLEAYEWFKEKFPERYEYLMSKKNQVFKINKQWLEEQISKYEV